MLLSIPLLAYYKGLLWHNACCSRLAVNICCGTHIRVITQTSGMITGRANVRGMGGGGQIPAGMLGNKMRTMCKIWVKFGIESTYRHQVHLNHLILWVVKSQWRCVLTVACDQHYSNEALARAGLFGQRYSLALG